MPDGLDHQIKALVVELVETSPRPADISIIAASIPTTTLSTPSRGPILMAKVAALVLIAGLAGGLIGRLLVPGDAEPDTVLDSPVFAVFELNASHPAARILDRGATTMEDFAAQATELDLDFVCASGGGRPKWELCLLMAGDLLAVVPFDGAPGLVARFENVYADQSLLVPLDTRDPIGLSQVQPGTTAIIEYAGEQIGRTSLP